MNLLQPFVCGLADLELLYYISGEKTMSLLPLRTGSSAVGFAPNETKKPKKISCMLLSVMILLSSSFSICWNIERKIS